MLVKRVRDNEVPLLIAEKKFANYYRVKPLTTNESINNIGTKNG